VATIAGRRRVGGRGVIHLDVLLRIQSRNPTVITVTTVIPRSMTVTD
jgi:hypothetical protein